MPDFFKRRQNLIEYLTKRYGENKEYINTSSEKCLDEFHMNYQFDNWVDEMYFNRSIVSDFMRNNIKFKSNLTDEQFEILKQETIKENPLEGREIAINEW